MLKGEPHTLSLYSNDTMLQIFSSLEALQNQTWSIQSFPRGWERILAASHSHLDSLRLSAWAPLARVMPLTPWLGLPNACMLATQAEHAASKAAPSTVGEQITRRLTLEPGSRVYRRHRTRLCSEENCPAGLTCNKRFSELGNFPSGLLVAESRKYWASEKR